MVEHDGATTAAYLHDKTSAIAATWIANHQQAPESTDLTRLNSGQCSGNAGRACQASGWQAGA